MIRPKRLFGLLQESGFEVEQYDRESRLVSFSRDSNVGEVIEVLRFHFSGRRGEIAPCELRVSLVRDAISVVDLCESELLWEVATEKEYGVTELLTSAGAAEWERLVAARAPDAVRTFASERSPGLLRKTEAVRSRAKAYVEVLRTDRPASDSLAWLEGRASDAQRYAAIRMAQTPGVQWIEDGARLYHTAALLLCCFASQVEPDSARRIIEADPLMETDVNQRIQLIVHYLFGDSLLLRPGARKL